MEKPDLSMHNFRWGSRLVIPENSPHQSRSEGKMPKYKSAKKKLISQWISGYTCLTTDGSVVFCQLCNKQVKCERKFQVVQHMDTQSHKRNENLNYISIPRKQLFLSGAISIDGSKEFAVDLCRAILAAGIPWYKTENPHFKEFLEKWCKSKVPHRTMLAKLCLTICYDEATNGIRNRIGDGYIWAAVDETTDTCGRYVAHLVVGSLEIEDQTAPFLLASKVLQKANSECVTRFVNDSLRILWPQSGCEDRLLVLLSDAAPYMVKAGDILSVLYPNMVHVTCVAHRLSRVAELVRQCFPQITVIVSSAKKVFLKAPLRVGRYKELLPDVPLPPEPVIIRWGTWLDAVMFYSENFSEIKEVIDSFDCGEAVAIKTAQEALAVPRIQQDLAYVHRNFSALRTCITKLEGQTLLLKEALATLAKAKSSNSTAEGPLGEKIKENLDSVLEKNSGLTELYSISRVSDGGH